MISHYPVLLGLHDVQYEDSIFHSFSLLIYNLLNQVLKKAATENRIVLHNRRYEYINNNFKKLTVCYSWAMGFKIFL